MELDMEILFPGDKGIDVRLGKHLIHTDQPPQHGGQDAYPAPLDLFLASIGACSGLFAQGFCQARGISTEGLGMSQRVRFDDKTHLPVEIRLALRLPGGFPDKYRQAIVRAVESCTIKKTLAAMPPIVVETVADAAEPVRPVA